MEMMSILFMMLFALGWMGLVIGGIMLIVAAFRQSLVWGFCVLLLGPAGLVFMIMHWEEAKRAVSVQLLGLLLCLGGFGVVAAKGSGVMDPVLARMVQSGLPEEPLEALQRMAPEMFADETGGDASATAAASGKRGPIDGKDPSTLLGATLEEVREALGRPKGQMTSGEGICLLYDGFTVFSKDGHNVSHVESGDDLKTPTGMKVASEPRASGSGMAQAVRKISNGGQPIDMKQLLVPGKVTVVDFYADWCAPCRRLGPQLEELARTDPDIVLCKIDVVNWESAVVRQFSIRSVPNVRVYDRNGTVVGSPSSDLEQIRQNIQRAR